MSVPTSGNSGSLQAEVISIKMDIDDDDEDVVIATVSITNEAPVPMGGLDVAVITNVGQKYSSVEGVTSLGPGIEREWTFEFPLDSGEWTFVLTCSSDEIKMGPYAHDFEYSVTQGRKLASNIGSSLFSGAFDNNLGDFGNVKEREMIDPTKVTMTSYAAENSQGGETLIKTDLDKLSTGLTATSSEGAHAPAGPPTPPPSEPPAGPPTPPSEPPAGPPTPPSGPPAGPPTPPSEPPAGPPTPPSGPPAGPPTPPPSEPPAGPPTPPSGPPAGPPTPPSGPPAGPPTPPSGPPAGPPTPPSGPPAGPPTPPSGPPAGPPTPPSGPPAGPPNTIGKPIIEMPEKPDI